MQASHSNQHLFPSWSFPILTQSYKTSIESPCLSTPTTSGWRNLTAPPSPNQKVDNSIRKIIEQGFSKFLSSQPTCVNRVSTATLSLVCRSPEASGLPQTSGNNCMSLLQTSGDVSGELLLYNIRCRRLQFGANRLKDEWESPTQNQTGIGLWPEVQFK